MLCSCAAVTTPPHPGPCWDPCCTAPRTSDTLWRRSPLSSTTTSSERWSRRPWNTSNMRCYSHYCYLRKKRCAYYSPWRKENDLFIPLRHGLCFRSIVQKEQLEAILLIKRNPVLRLTLVSIIFTWDLEQNLLRKSLKSNVKTSKNQFKFNKDNKLRIINNKLDKFMDK